MILTNKYNHYCTLDELNAAGIWGGSMLLTHKDGEQIREIDNKTAKKIFDYIEKKEYNSAFLVPIIIESTSSADDQ
jgi:hypothetical protein